MENNGQIIIIINGKNGDQEINPGNFDIKDLRIILEQVDHLLFPNEKYGRPLISYSIEKGSIRHIFKTSLQAVISFNAILDNINSQKNIDFLELPTAMAIETFQNLAKKRSINISISTSIEKSSQLNLDKDTNFIRKESIWVESEFYFYGNVVSAGGKENVSIKLLSDNYGLLNISTPRDFLKNYEKNILFKEIGIRASCRQHSQSGEIDKSHIGFIELIDYSPDSDKFYLDGLRKKAKWLKNIDPDLWLNELRGNEI